MLRRARRGARLSQTDLARRAGVAQPMISAYESGRREPSLPTLARLIEATGHGLSVELVPPPRDRFGLPDTRLGRRLRRHRRAVLEIAAARGARNVRVFGSVARGEDTATSDIDLLVDLDKGVGVVALAGLRRELTELLGVGVDVVPAATLKPAVRAEVLGEAITL
ncbi:putative nucleotidyltransferase [Saccharomonospora marina XMU15]|uniref:Putative nucleotidyltransferase n=2 Tax=Saccharomonospora TaxID=1851 RepID=H5X7D5_9PSEU|nr:putative nucleotidyltransferase [Saccharomonospora marina XMU15]